MHRSIQSTLRVALGAAILAFAVQAQAQTPQRSLPPPALELPASRAGLQTATFAGGCFWGVQAVFQHVKGVEQAVSGYTGGMPANPSYEQVSTGTTGHAEVVRVTFDPAQVTYATLLQIFFTVALDPTQRDRQGPDIDTQYRSELFVEGPEQDRVARAYVAQLIAAHVFPAPIATRISPAAPFYAAEAYHQDYLQLHPNQPYIAMHDMPKVRHLEAAFPQSWHSRAATVGKLASGS